MINSPAVELNIQYFKEISILGIFSQRVYLFAQWLALPGGGRDETNLPVGSTLSR